MGDESVAGGRRFDHERLDVYRVALEFAVWKRDFVHGLPRGNADLADQLTRACTSVVLNIAEGSGEFSPADRAHFFRIARRSALECAAALDLFELFHVATRERLADARGLLKRVVAMLSVLTRPGRVVS